MNREFEFFPRAASTTAGDVDALMLLMVALSAVVTVVIATLIVWLAIKYRRGNRVDRRQEPTSITTELLWIALPIPILLLIFVWGAKVGFTQLRPPRDAMPITVVAKQWMWKFQHDDGCREIDTLHVPVNQPVHLTMISQDVIHSFFVPAFRVKQDVLPARYTSLWFEATEPGEYRLYCAEYCGTNHSRMVGKVVALTPSEFAAWKSGRTADEPPAVSGEKLFDQLQCGSCHRSAAPQRAPSLQGIYNQPQPLTGGGTVIADDAYLRESILRPTTKVVAGFQPIMPTYEGQVSEEGLLHLIAYIRSLGAEGANAAAPQEEGARQ